MWKESKRAPIGMLLWLVILASCSGSVSDDKKAPLKIPAGLLGPGQKETESNFQAILFIPGDGCACEYLQAYGAVTEVLGRDSLSCGLTVSVSSKERYDYLAKMGLDRSCMVCDPEGRFLSLFGLRNEDLPYFLLVSRADIHRVVAAFRLTRVSGDQALAGSLLQTLRSRPGGLR